jgi:hypothetical protein
VAADDWPSGFIGLRATTTGAALLLAVVFILAIH